MSSSRSSNGPPSSPIIASWSRSATCRLGVIALLTCLRAALMSRGALALDNAALGQQLTIYQRRQKRLSLQGQEVMVRRPI